MKHLLQLETHTQYKEAYEWLNNPNQSSAQWLEQIQRNHFTPRWVAKPAIPPKLCNVEQCEGKVHAHTSLMSAASLETCFKAKVRDPSTLVGLERTIDRRTQ